MKSENYITIQGWMRTELRLKGNELILYALIFGFSRNDISKFEGSLSYMQEALGVSRPTVVKTLASLNEKGLIKKTKRRNGNSYSISKKNLPVKKLNTDGKESLPKAVKKLNTDGKESLPNNTIYKDNHNNYIKKKKTSFDVIIEQYTDNEKLAAAIYDFIKMRKTIKKPLTDRALKIMLDKLNKLSEGEAERTDILNQSIFHSWQGVFPMKEHSARSWFGKKKSSANDGVISHDYTQKDYDEILSKMETM